MNNNTPAGIVYRLAVFLACLPVTLLAQTGAKVEGTVTDSATGQPIAGVQVSVEGTRLGNVTTDNGYYFILNVPPGERTVTFSHTSYRSVSIRGIRLSAGHTSTVDAALGAGVIQMEGIVVQADEEPLVPRDNVQTAQRFGGDVADQAPAENLEQLISLQAGVATDPYGHFNIRGSRQGRQAVYIDGMLVRSFNELSLIHI